jgi:hypothetical protein
MTRQFPSAKLGVAARRRMVKDQGFLRAVPLLVLGVLFTAVRLYSKLPELHLRAVPAGRSLACARNFEPLPVPLSVSQERACPPDFARPVASPALGELEADSSGPQPRVGILYSGPGAPLINLNLAPMTTSSQASQGGDVQRPHGKKNNPGGQQENRPYSPTATSGSPGHIFWIVPAFKVNYAKHFEPLTPKEKFQEWAQSSYDPLGFAISAFEAGTLEHSSTDGFCGYGPGWGGYGECLGSLELDSNVSSFIGDFAFTVLMHQDPRYFRLGEGGFGKRFWHAFSRVFVTHSDSGGMVFYSSALSATAIAAALSNLYYPSQDVGVGHTMSRIGIDLGNTVVYNLAAEYWPDIDRELHRAF